MPKTNKARIEIYLSQDSAEDLKLIELWNTLNQSGRGRAQAFFRRALSRGIKTTKLPDTPDDIKDIINQKYSVNKRRGPKKSWQPKKHEEDKVTNDINNSIQDIKEIEINENKIIPDNILDEYKRTLEEQEPTPETLGFLEEKYSKKELESDLEGTIKKVGKKKSRIGGLM